jgi:kynureninase
VNESHTIPDFRPPDLLRFGFAPLYIGYADVDEAVRRIVEVVESGGIDRWRGVQSVVP